MIQTDLLLPSRTPQYFTNPEVMSYGLSEDVGCNFISSFEALAKVDLSPKPVFQ
jgi:hypothetical protein